MTKVGRAYLTRANNYVKRHTMNTVIVIAHHHFYNQPLPGGGNTGLGAGVFVVILIIFYNLVKSPKIPKGK